MSARRAIAGLSLTAAAAALVAVAVASPSQPRASAPSKRVAGPRPSLAVVSMDGVVEAVAPDGARRVLARLHPPAEASIRAVTSDGGWVFLDVDVRTQGDVSFAGALVGVRSAPDSEGAAPVELARDVVHASTPLPFGDRVLVSRGAAGPTIPGVARVDELSIDAISPTTGAIETIAKHRGYLLFLAGATDREILLYRVGVDGADIVAVDPTDPAHPTRTLAQGIAPYARDFSVDAIDGRLVFVNRREDGAWAVVALDLESRGDRLLTELVSGPRMALIPEALPFTDERGHAEILLTEDPEVGPALLRGRALGLGPGAAHVADADPKTGWFTGTFGPSGARARVFVANAWSGEVDAWPAPDRPAFVAGFLRGGE